MRQLPLVIQHSDLSLSSSIDSSSIDSSSINSCLLPAALQDSIHANSGISEIIISADSALQPIYLLPILSQMAIDKRWLMWVAAKPTINRNWIAAMGIDAAQILHVSSENSCLHTICCKALAAGTGHLIIEWEGSISEHELFELEEAAREGNSNALLIRRRER